MSKNIEDAIIALIEEALDEARRSYHISDTPPVYLEVPKKEVHGDLATNIALKISQRIEKPSGEIASLMVGRMKNLLMNSPLRARIERIEVKGPGFINFFLTRKCLYNILIEVQKRGENFGRSNLGRGQKVQIEFVSANPTGPLSVAHGRQAAAGDSLANILSFCGYKVTREYYINDEGSQIDLLGESVRARCLELIGELSEFPQNGYRGGYIFDIAREIIKKRGKKYPRTEKRLVPFSTYAYRSILKTIKKDLKDFGVKFDVWFSQKQFAKTGSIDRVLKQLEKQGYIYPRKGALWFKSTEFGDDKDRVVRKSDGSFTYIAPDIAYHKYKYKRGFTKLINIWGPDHHGYIPRLKAAIQALGYPPESVSFLIIQLATLYKAGKPIPMSTRVGEFITLREIMDEVGRDAARFFFLMRKRDSHLDFDLELAKKQSPENPVYYIQYGHARICSILEYRKKRQRIYSKQVQKRYGAKVLNLSVLKEPEELEILKILMRFPKVIEQCARNLEPYGIIPYLQDLAASFHRFYERHRVVTDDLEKTEARLMLVDSIRQLFGNSLRLLGVSSPKKM